MHFITAIKLTTLIATMTLAAPAPVPADSPCQFYPAYDVALPVVWASVPLPPPVRAMYTATEGWGVFVTEGVGEV
ncbi:hypothetical protein PENNAL_c0007G02397 [Penicillium nalgiovense]|uniref:Uncharacterized protein n=1 Tax=Penicillium nalgiovense TaxID=60175 RepID=A0A1V6YYX1_PENNA|nr:hypothetical protein PENNAL_c0007G02397 [Penicillium nalgiovense]